MTSTIANGVPSVNPDNPPPINPKLPLNWQTLARECTPTHFYDADGNIAYTLTPVQVANDRNAERCAARSDGLVGSCINDRPLPPSQWRTTKVTVQRGLLKVACWQPNAPRGGIRGKIGEFSRASRKRMLEKVASIRETTRGAFITLTYPDVFPDDPATWARDMATFIKRLKRAYPDARGIWRKEIKTRKTGEVNAGNRAPHFHLIVWGLDTGDPVWLLQLIQWTATAWFEVHGIDHAAKGKAGTRCEMIEDMRHALRYTSKYCAKPDGAEEIDVYGGAEKFGRHWGSFGNLDLSPSFELWVSYEQTVELRRMAARWLRSRKSLYWRRISRMHKGFSVFGLGDTNEFGKSELFATVFSMLEMLIDIPITRAITAR